ncbi:hypothetical protein PUNSTDRAFT_74683 [Punctularia strigosozonata HHB-11173 SS5]|uniref:uncharacterized protein n=1 Tax=Punctularia strigosozonata (strain HHB-11173) TaxID=741275 RepID=UPI00044180B8|nr:uncharacterized protein PUNSTDRAFT_74683 [Punctularia strigosozonata HHB-11173 SS5]EIN05521.1 hypothetical protein PUNSTDRAFT_74683 [Punctularia strigosozonata HHB-11173 SS5]
MTSDQEVQRLRLEKQDLERSIEQQTDRVDMANERVRKAETFANECQIELGRVRVENSELDKQNATLDKQIKELKLRIVDLETKSFASSPRPPRRMDSRIEELTSQLNQSSRDKTDSVRLQRTADQATRDVKYQLAESDRQRARLEDEIKGYEARVQNLRDDINELTTSQSEMQLAQRRAEREAADYKRKALDLEREVERLRSRLDRPASSLLDRGSPMSSPRKFGS